ncbi:WD40 repeat domain-containing protein [Bradyrhizobium sp.]|uniref:WD40 repeat domain-containing protein n=1 Tax=Bradyrhizobium sp. TaxID=376 RepID=UPI001EC75EA6|nr:WD40 repeat domain-containing protein [Bradyrhizobium sp.]MBV9978390.1 WD40 repeat domain-containing protein [Bradyrhizobium sp.]
MTPNYEEMAGKERAVHLAESAKFRPRGSNFGLFRSLKRKRLAFWNLKSARWATGAMRPSAIGPARRSVGMILKTAPMLTLLTSAVAQVPRPSLEVIQASIPQLLYQRTLPAPNRSPNLGASQSGNAGLTLSSDGARLAAYVLDGLQIMTWSPDGTYKRAIPRYTSFGLDAYVLKFIAGHHLLITSPAAETNDPEAWRKIEDIAFSVMDPETGKVLHNVPGPNPGHRANENVAVDMTVSPDEHFVAVIFRGFTRGRVAVFSTDDWHQVSALDLHNGDKGDDLDPLAIAFSPDNRTLAIAHGLFGRIKLYEVGSWKLVRTITTFPEAPPPADVLLVDAISFSPDGSMVAVASHGGGSWWKLDDHVVAEGTGVLRRFFPADPLRVFRVEDGERVAALGSFPGGLGSSSQLTWLAKGDCVAFLDGVGDIRLWKPFAPGYSAVVARMGSNSRTILASKDSSRLFANSPDGVAIFDIIQAHSGIAQ